MPQQQALTNPGRHGVHHTVVCVAGCIALASFMLGCRVPDQEPSSADAPDLLRLHVEIDELREEVAGLRQEVAKLRGGEGGLEPETPTPHAKPGTAIEHCDTFGKNPFLGLARPGKRCFSADPQFRDPKNFDYRLKPTSPCRGKASDGGDIGCRFTPEMLEMLKLAHELRKKGIIKF